MMDKIELTSSELFKNLVEATINNHKVDLHNEYDCDYIKYIEENKSVLIGFSKTEEQAVLPRKILLSFGEAYIKSIRFDFEQSDEKPTIDNFYRGRFEKGNSLYEVDEGGRFYFYVSFVEEYHLELFAKTVELVIEEI